MVIVFSSSKTWVFSVDPEWNLNPPVSHLHFPPAPPVLHPHPSMFQHRTETPSSLISSLNLFSFHYTCMYVLKPSHYAVNSLGAIFMPGHKVSHTAASPESKTDCLFFFFSHWTYFNLYLSNMLSMNIIYHFLIRKLTFLLFFSLNWLLISFWWIEFSLWLYRMSSFFVGLSSATILKIATVILWPFLSIFLCFLLTLHSLDLSFPPPPHYLYPLVLIDQL